MAFDDHQLDEIKSRIKMSDLIGRKRTLRRQGSEWVDADNQSFTVNDSKGLFWDFGGGGDKGEGGDCFDYLVKHEGFTFVGAVEECAKFAGVEIKHVPGQSKPQGERKKAAPRKTDDAPRATKEIVGEWSYYGRDGEILYQVVRMQRRLPDGSWEVNKEGKKWKSFGQRRPSPNGDGSWVWSLDFVDRKTSEAIEFIRPKGSDSWMRATDERKEEWRNYDLRTFGGAGNVDHWLYNSLAVADEMEEPLEDQRTIFFPEGEAKVDVLKEWDLLAVTNSGGAKNFTPDCAAFFAKAADVVILVDNDRAGIERAKRVAPMIVAAGCKRVRVMNIADVWRDAPHKSDVKDWREAGGTRDDLLEAVDALRDWRPEPYKSKFGAKTFRDLGGKARPYPWRIKNIVPRDDNLLVMGPSRSGKTFEMLDICMHVHNGEPYAGQRTEPGGVVYLTYEGATGFESRLRAYLKHHDKKPEDLHSFAWITRPPGLYASEDNARELAKEIAELASNFALPLAATVVDTHNAATRGSSEIKSEDITKIQQNYSIVTEALGVPLWIVGHTNAEGKHRGNEAFFNNIEAALLVERVYTDKNKKIEKRDENNCVIRRVSTNKQREGADDLHWDFVLHRVVIGKDQDGDDIGSMVSVEPLLHTQQIERSESHDRADGFRLTQNHASVFRALLKAMDEYGEPPPPETRGKMPSSIVKVVQWSRLGIEVKRSVPKEADESQDKYRDKIKARTKRFREDLLPYGVIGMIEVEDPKDPEKTIHYVWPTGKPVTGPGLRWPERTRRKKADDKPIVDEATGEEITSLDGAPPSTVF